MEELDAMDLPIGRTPKREERNIACFSSVTTLLVCSDTMISIKYMTVYPKMCRDTLLYKVYDSVSKDVPRYFVV